MCVLLPFHHPSILFLFNDKVDLKLEVIQVYTSYGKGHIIGLILLVLLLLPIIALLV